MHQDLSFKVIFNAIPMAKATESKTNKWNYIKL